MTEFNHYQTLEINLTATQAEIKQAYRRMAKRFHPDSNPEQTDRDRITKINQAYEILGDPQRRRTYDRQLHAFNSTKIPAQPTTSYRKKQYRSPQTGQETDELLQRWIQSVYVPVNRWLAQILNSLEEQIDDLSADPFDDELLEDFQAYLSECRELLTKAQSTFSSIPNPSNVASVAAHLYHCLNQVGDGIEELNWFTLNYDDRYLHTGQELFRIAAKLRREAHFAMKEIPECYSSKR